MLILVKNGRDPVEQQGCIGQQNSLLLKLGRVAGI